MSRSVKSFYLFVLGKIHIIIVFFEDAFNVPKSEEWAGLGVWIRDCDYITKDK